jgi:choline dehydrogenase-like flavoprotein
MHGLVTPPKTIDQAANVREDAGRAYYWPVANRSNLALFQNTYANKLVWDSYDSDEAVASGVEVVTSNGTTTVIYATNEVIISAGALRSPLILELSGVGNPAILCEHNISVVVNLPTVGENLQDQANNGMTFGDNTTLVGAESFIAYPTVTDLFGDDLASFAATTFSSLSSYATAVAKASNNVVSASDLLSFFKLQYDLVFNSSTPLLEIYITPASSVFSFEYWTLLPFSRGNIHITSSNATAAAAINPNYFMLDFDIDAQVAGAKYIRKIMATNPLASYNTGEISPVASVLPANATDAQYGNYLKSAFRSNFHPVGTAAMMPRKIGGVVDSRLKVYGTKNVRVVDASVIPFQVCGHLTSTLYAVAEKAADLIKEDM